MWMIQVILSTLLNSCGLTLNCPVAWFSKIGSLRSSYAAQQMDLLGLFQISLITHDGVHLVGQRLTKVFNYTAARLLRKAKLARSYRLMLLSLHHRALRTRRGHIA